MARLIFAVFTTFIISCSSRYTVPRQLCKGNCKLVNNFCQDSPYTLPIVDKADWGGRAPTTDPTNIGFSVPFVAIHHTYIPGACQTLNACKTAMRSMQDHHQLTNGWSDIGYNFAIGAEGSVFEGRGWDVVGAHAIGVNSRSVGIALIGDFVSSLPSRKQLNAAQNLIAAGIRLGHISPDYKLIGHRQVSATECPGQALFDEISTWKHFYDGEI